MSTWAQDEIDSRKVRNRWSILTRGVADDWTKLLSSHGFRLKNSALESEHQKLSDKLEQVVLSNRSEWRSLIEGLLRDDSTSCWTHKGPGEKKLLLDEFMDKMLAIFCEAFIEVEPYLQSVRNSIRENYFLADR